MDNKSQETQLLKAELEKLGVETDIDGRNTDTLLFLHLKFPSGMEFDLQPSQDFPGDDGMPIIDLSVDLGSK